MQYAIEETVDDNTGLPCWLVVDTFNDTTVDRVFDRSDADDLCDFYNDRASEDLYEDDPGEYQEWQDFNPDC